MRLLTYDITSVLFPNPSIRQIKKQKSKTAHHKTKDFTIPLSSPFWCCQASGSTKSWQTCPLRCCKQPKQGATARNPKERRPLLGFTMLLSLWHLSVWRDVADAALVLGSWSRNLARKVSTKRPKPRGWKITYAAESLSIKPILTIIVTLPGAASVVLIGPCIARGNWFPACSIVKIILLFQVKKKELTLLWKHEVQVIACDVYAVRDITTLAWDVGGARVGGSCNADERKNKSLELHFVWFGTALPCVKAERVNEVVFWFLSECCVDADDEDVQSSRSNASLYNLCFGINLTYNADLTFAVRCIWSKSPSVSEILDRYRGFPWQSFSISRWSAYSSQTRGHINSACRMLRWSWSSEELFAKIDF